MASESKDDVVVGEAVVAVAPGEGSARPRCAEPAASTSAAPAAPEVEEAAPTAGALYARYLPLAAARDTTEAMDPGAYLAAVHAAGPATAAAVPAAAVAGDGSSSISSAAAAARLANWCVCRTCGGDGVERVVYNHMVMSRTCRTCDGEGVVGPPPPPPSLPLPTVASVAGGTSGGDGGPPPLE